MRASSIAVLVVAAMLATPAVATAQLSQERTLTLAFDVDGLVSLRAQNVTPREILAEWKRQCQCAVVDAEKLTAGPIVTPLVFDKAPQSMVLETLLRQAAGVILTPRRAGAAGPSNFETIFVLATSTPTASPYSSSFSPVTAPTYQTNISTPGSPADEIPPVTPGQQPSPNVTRAPGTQYTPGLINSPNPTTNGPGPLFVPITPIGTTPKPAGGGTTPLGGKPGGGGGQ